MTLEEEKWRPQIKQYGLQMCKGGFSSASHEDGDYIDARRWKGGGMGLLLPTFGASASDMWLN